MSFLFLIFYLNAQGKPVDKCLTGHILQEFQRTGKISAKFMLLKKKDAYYTTHFVIYYDPTQVSLAYVESTAKYFEYSWEIQVDTLGWDPPPIPPVVGYYEVGLQNLSGGVLGFTSPDSAGPDTTQEEYYSHIVVDIGLDYNTLKATVSHEFNHACQFSYTAYDAIWFYENCATWMEDMVYDDVNDYINYLLYANNPLNFPDSAITTFSDGLYQYGGCLFPMFLSEWLNTPRVITDIWSRMGSHFGDYTIPDIDYVLKNNYGTGLDTALFYYGEWRFFTGSYNDGYHFEEAGLWPSPYILNQHTSYPASGDNTSRVIVEPGGTHFIRFSLLGGKNLIVSFDGIGLRLWNVRLIQRGGVVPYPYIDMDIDQTTGDGVDTTAGGVPEVVMVVTDAKFSGILRSNVTFSYTADATLNISDNLSNQGDFDIFFVNANKYLILSPLRTQFYLFDLTGRLVSFYNIKPGKNYITLDKKGIFILKQKDGNKKFKIIGY